MKTHLLSGLAATCLPCHLHAQGPLTPPGVPAPAMKTLHELWDKVGVLETTGSGQRQLIAQHGALIDLPDIAHGGALPWTLSIEESAGEAGAFTSLAFTSSGQPAISGQHLTHSGLKDAVRQPFTKP